MEIYQREVERKFVWKGMSYSLAYSFLSCLSRPTVTATSFDLYWEAPNVDFIRLRENSHEITVKLTDKGNILDRLEENVEVTSDAMPAARKLLTLLHGPPSLKLTKRFSVFSMDVSPAPGTHFQAILCLYQVHEDAQERLFFEVEAESLVVVDHVLGSLGIPSRDLQPEGRSLFQIFNQGGQDVQG